MRVLDTATILAAMAQVGSSGPRAQSRRGPGSATDPSRGARPRSCHRPAPAAIGERETDRAPGDADDKPRRASNLVVVPQGVIPVIVISSRLAAASRATS